MGREGEQLFTSLSELHRLPAEGTRSISRRSYYSLSLSLPGSISIRNRLIETKFYSGDCYILQYTYAGLEMEENLFYAWLGCISTLSYYLIANIVVYGAGKEEDCFSPFVRLLRQAVGTEASCKGWLKIFTKSSIKQAQRKSLMA
ncbi:hypothetical protein RHMOL_Rhmol05G0232700 [Rhododendron molle]|uniref:Uncharacterized protein n=3 Tax=Rhododendron molle TaxID=49168 RepID=A0ACC0NSB5_RHOML|nr:hypothetical protein RHMOL_Rhmol05G0232700 [Rhododendron molle]KAI8556189.1 hypothetical protein RHMOL_Rhmol05G0232700 [Rhododendron molle]KAI8556190.1 hypothetical protein RHMOL_Rhmol05G0232700 [Rhododendron molle]